MIFRQVLRPATGGAWYLFGCTGQAALAVVDPHAEHVADYLALAEQAHSPIVVIFETHRQADHLSGAAELARRTGATIYLHEAAQVDFPHEAVGDRDVIGLGNDCVRVLHTPGHTLDSISLVVGDRVRTADPRFVLTGDALFVGDVGRPDLNEGGDEVKRQAAEQRYEGLFGKLLRLPDHLAVCPAHSAGSACGRAMSGKPCSTIGFERRFNLALQPRSRADCVALVLEGLPPQPAQHRGLLAANRRGGLRATV